MPLIILPHRCKRCKRWLRKTPGPYGPRCVVRVNAACRVLEESRVPVAERAAEALRDGALAPLRSHGGRVYRAVSSDGRRTYLTHRCACNCQAGLYAKPCYHKVAAAVLQGRMP